MTRLVVFVCLAATPLADAAPAPPETEKEKIARLWGRTVGPAGGGRFTLRGERLAIRSTAAPVVGWPTEPRWTALRVTRAWTGDFDLRVRLDTLTVPSRAALHNRGSLQTTAGLFVAGGGSFLTVHRSLAFHVFDGVIADQLDQCVWVDRCDAHGGGGNRLAETIATRPVHLRLTRQAGVISLSSSDDGVAWAAPRVFPDDLPDEVTVGVFVSHTPWQECEAVFDQYALTVPKK